MSLYLPESAAAWGQATFAQTLQREVAGLGLEVLPLQSQLRYSAYALPDDISTMLLSAELQSGWLSLHVGVFFKGAIPGCACADDPTPEETYNEYCELEIRLNLESAQATLVLWDGYAAG
ncbi:MAG: hypothetical protein OEW58_06680 [Gammaproteobacteria bacterium]|nr:hypothetical protein [Gammaproteobacteria bacterium]